MSGSTPAPREHGSREHGSRASGSREPGARGAAPPVGTVLLESGRPDRDGGRSLRFENPIATETLAPGGDPLELFARLQAHLDAGRWIAGALAFEAGYPLLGLPLPVGTVGALAWFGVYDAPAEMPPDAPSDVPSDPSAATGPGPASVDDATLRSGTNAFRFATSPRRWRGQVDGVHDRIRAGETYQVNLTGRMRFRAGLGGWAAYRAWSRAHPVPFAAYLRPGDDHEIVSLSPELFVRSDGQAVWTRPMKGTAPRGSGPSQDDALAAALRADPKALAENVMIVDLLRNDLGRVATYGSVVADPLFEVERYPTVLQMTSTVRGELRPELRGRALPSVLEAMFPCGSVTGAPKRATMEAIAEIEDEPRGTYTGAIGYAAPDGAFVFSVAIRTAEIRSGRGVLGLGSGIVIDSVADEEYREALLKGAFARSA
ncbi:MAG: anthranilate synthase component I family protein [Trueperaceae bacterium]|nr:anthranilate synthase component I family protein [Trueperaceae bacterium]